MILEENSDSLELKDYTERAYLDYSMYVINDRALPFVGDGLKPVQRRIIYAMQRLGITHQSKYAKSARTIGEVIGKYHPHGETACYESMVVMAQPFSYRYPLIDGQGNWGATDEPKSFAAQRYTESRLTKIAALLFTEIQQGTVDFTPNFDGTLQEPVTLPAQAPFLLMNGCTGIAVGMATDILPHNLRSVINACIALLSSPSITSEELLDIIAGPDFPTGGIITSSREELLRMYETGQGSVRCRARYELNDGEIIVTELPYQSSPARILEQIARQMQAKKLPYLDDIRDESDHENPTRLVLVPRSNRVEVDRLMHHLFATTDLERSFRWNFNVIGLNSRPKVFSLKEFLKEWLQYRKIVVRRRLTYRIEQIDRRIEIINGLLIAHLNIDEVLQIVREEEQPKLVLIQRFKLTEVQANAILDLRIRQLSRLEHVKLSEEQATLAAERVEKSKVLNSPRGLNSLIRQELRQILDSFGDDRKTDIDHGAATALAYTETDIVTKEPVTVVLSERGWIRVRKGHEDDISQQLNYREGDSCLISLQARMNEQCIFFDNLGRTYTLPIATLPSAKGYGEPLTKHLSPPSGSQFIGLASTAAQEMIVSNSHGEGFRLPITEVITQMKGGKAVVILDESRVLLQPMVAPTNGLLALITQSGRLLVIRINDVPIRKKGKGVRLISLPKKDLFEETDKLSFARCVDDATKFVLYSGKRKKIFRNQDLTDYLGNRGTRGKLLPKGFRKVDSVDLE